MNNINPIYKSVVIFVENIERSRNFYEEVLNQTIIADFGRNVGYENGLSIWDKDYALKTIFKDKINEINPGKFNAELYFEYDDLEILLKRFEENDVPLIHPIIEHPWGQRGLRIYDPDDHIIEISESMEAVVLRLYENGINVKEISEKTMLPIEYIKQLVD
ncbi:MAG: glyoxalase/bleomycin resistance/dioxygenase family protein [Candidatus Lokiarchaeota archaeon]|nr:glyoxalase/bleomycin resistance/dioxygenase family protein [Candidatus Lokiarchaeota archaeon]MBD3200290.1 glyoxalase/bleomycin resistance/dioxygenase family protein [Candidatus Lokiarchaeota archaeon]